MREKRKIPKLTAALVLAGILLLLGGTVLAATSAPDVISEDYKTEFELDHIDVALVENGTMSEDIKSGKLLSGLNGKVQPGRSYREELSARNMSDTPEIVRMIVRTYWTDEEGRKDTTKDPSMIRLSYKDNEYNTSSWQINPEETTAERKVYYLSRMLPAGSTTDPVVDTLRVDNKVLDEVEVKEEKKGQKTVYTYSYKYDGLNAVVEADVQSVQTHNPNESIKSAWGVGNVSVRKDVVKVG